MAKTLKKGQRVRVIAGSHKGKEGRILQVIPARDRVIVEGVAMVKRHTRKTQNDEGGIVEREASIHRSNVAILSDEGAEKAS
jgi:large subunit ribosomal protein L24